MSTLTQKHTPGPWRSDDGRECAYMAEKGLASHRIFGDGWVVAVIIADVEEVSASAEANARLIAAAPDLLAAAKLYMARIPVDGESNYQLEAYEALNDAIFKAES